MMEKTGCRSAVLSRSGSVPNERSAEHVGRDLDQIAREQDRDPYDTLFDLLIDTKANITMVFSMLRPEDMHTVIKHPLAMVGTDAIPCPPEPAARIQGDTAHFPRSWGGWYEN